MQTTSYFRDKVLQKRPYLMEAICRAVVEKPLQREVQLDGRIRHWGRVYDAVHLRWRFLRVVTLPDGVTLHNAFYDRDFVEPKP